MIDWVSWSILNVFLRLFTHGDAIRDDRFEFTSDSETEGSGSIMKINRSWSKFKTIRFIVYNLSRDSKYIPGFNLSLEKHSPWRPNHGAPWNLKLLGSFVHPFYYRLSDFSEHIWKKKLSNGLFGSFRRSKIWTSPGKCSLNFGKCFILWDPDCCASSFLLCEESANDPVYPTGEPYSSSMKEQSPYRIDPAVQHGFNFSGWKSDIERLGEIL